MEHLEGVPGGVARAEDQIPAGQDLPPRRAGELYGRPILLERGRPVEARRADVERFWASGALDTESNVQFGEGGAGAFSDGKLSTG